MTLELALVAEGTIVRPAIAGQVMHELVNRACADAPRSGRIRASTRDVPAGEPGAPTAWVEFLLEAPGSASPHVWGQLASPLLGGQAGRGKGPRLEVSRTSGKGTSLRLQLPCAGRARSRRSGSGPLVLLVEDDHLVRDSLAEVLREKGYRVVVAENGESALEELAEVDRPVDLLVTDIMMPRMSGIELARRLVARQPSVKVLFLSALPLPRGAVLPGPLVPKPLDLSVLLQQLPSLVAGMLDAPAA